MNRARTTVRFWMICVWSLAPGLSPSLSQAQDQVIETLKKQLAEMHESMKKMAARIDQLEREKTTANLRVDQVEKSTKALQSAPSALNPAIGMAIDATAEHR